MTGGNFILLVALLKTLFESTDQHQEELMWCFAEITNNTTDKHIALVIDDKIVKQFLHLLVKEPHEL